MHLNMFYGIFGRKSVQLEVKNILDSDLTKYFTFRIVKSFTKLTDKITSVVMYNNVDYSILKEINSTLENNLKSPFNRVQSNVAIAAAVTAYARMVMLPYKLLDSIYYTDTDSVFLDVPLDFDLIGNELGQMKDVLANDKDYQTDVIKEAYFLGIKRYGLWFINHNGQRVEKSVISGVKKDTVSFQEIEDVYNGKTIVKDIPVRFFKSMNTMDVKVDSTKTSLFMNNRKPLVDGIYQAPNIYLDKEVSVVESQIRLYYSKIKGFLKSTT